MAGLGVLVLLVLATLLGPFIWPQKIDTIDFTVAINGPSADHPFGTDDLGRDIFARALWGGRVSIAVGITAVLLAITLGTAFGALAGYFRRLDNPLMRITDLFLSLPILPLLLIIIFGIKLRWFPFIYSSTLQVHDLATLGQQIKQSIMPITVLALFDVATIARYVRAEMLEHLPLDYVRTARGKGLMERFVVLRHVLRNSLIPVVTLVALGVPAVFGGAIVTEQVFRVPGIGELLVTSIGNGDIPVVATVVFIFAVLVVLFNLLADILYAVLDPRIRYS